MAAPSTYADCVSSLTHSLTFLTSGATRARTPGARGKGLAGERALKARAVRTRKEGLKYSVERLELQGSQKERELRKRLEEA
ncbi:HC-toxin synthetase [Verticillium dahliae VDG2]|nr:HC-toxin synthetase [Verticillium dahliae VDG2]